MALPVSLLTGSDLPDNNYYCGPFKAPNQAIYVIAIASGANITVVKAADPTVSFSEQDASNKPAVGSPQSVWGYLSGSEIHIVGEVGFAGGDPHLHYHVFDTASDTWTTVDEAVETLKDDPTAVSCSIAVRSDGDVIVLYNGDTDSDMGNPYDRVDYARREVSSWTVGIAVGATTPANLDRTGSVIVRGSADNMHFFWVGPRGIDELRARSLDASNSLSTERVLDLSSADAGAHSWTPGIAWNDGGTWRVVLPTKDFSTFELVVVRWVESSGALAASPGTTVVGSPEDVRFTRQLCSSLDGDGQMYVMWGGGGVSGADEDLYRDDAAPPYTTWSGETEVIDATTIEKISCNIYPRDGAIKLAFVYDEAGTIKYNEVSITAPTAPAMADSRFPDQNYKIGPFSV
jgi:hypothetical protein